MRILPKREMYVILYTSCHKNQKQCNFLDEQIKSGLIINMIIDEHKYGFMTSMPKAAKGKKQTATKIKLEDFPCTTFVTQ